MERYFLNIAYKGTHYHGWQIQQNARSVQEEINKALSTILQQEIKVAGAGRTDTGVHAEELFAHFNADISFTLKKLQYKLNTFLPEDIVIKDLFKVEKDAHARFSATYRTYEYRVVSSKNPFTANLTYFFPYKLDVGAMNLAAAEILKHTDFSSFSKSKTDTFTNDCTITEAFWIRKEEQLIFTITANRFLRNMVRAIVGTLLEVGQGKLSVEDVSAIIEKKNRSKAGTSAPAEGLFLTKVAYPDSIFSLRSAL